MSTVMARRLAGITPRRTSESGDSRELSESSSLRVKPQSSPLLLICLILLGILFIVGYNSGRSGFKHQMRSALSQDDESIILVDRNATTVGEKETGEEAFLDFLTAKDVAILASKRIHPECRVRICPAIPVLKEMYGTLMHRTLHMGPGTCGVVAMLKEEESNEVWGIQPFQTQQPIHKICQGFIRKGIVRVGDPSKIPYRAKSFSFVLVTGTLERMSSKELNHTLLDLARVTSDRLVLVVGSGASSNITTKSGKIIKPRLRSWWQRRLESLGLEEDKDSAVKFKALQKAVKLETTSNIFHLRILRDIVQ